LAHDHDQLARRDVVTRLDVVDLDVVDAEALRKQRG